jgi:L-malate glycosyltransferase
VRIDQWVPAAHIGDAIGDSARRVRAALRARSITSDLYALTIDEELRGDVLPFGANGATQADATIFHFALPSPMTRPFAELRGTKILQYHNITPSHFFAPYDRALARLASLGREELVSLAGRVDFALGDSDFNRQELEAIGFERTGVMPIAIDLARITDAPRRLALEEALDDGLTNVLFVGRVAPNKRLEDHVKLAEHYKRYVDAECRFIFVGRYDLVPRYHAMVRALVVRYRMLPDRFIFTGPVPDEDLATYYRMADAYVSLSEHEGFCVPLIEAMAADVPVLAYASTVIPETLAGAGVQFSPKDLEYAAELLGMLVYDDAIRERVIDGQRRRVREFGPERIDREVDLLLRKIG